MIAPDRNSQRGQAIALFALALTAIVLGAAVGVDGGYAYAQRRQAQNAADFAAMAGTRIVGIALTGVPAGAGTAANVREAVSSTITANDAQLVKAEYVDHAGYALGDVMTAAAIPNNAFGVVVNARTNWKPFLLGVIGITDWAATSSAAALTDGESTGGGVLPVGISEQQYNALASCPADAINNCLQQPLTPGHLIGPGSFGWLSFGLQGNGGKCDWTNSLGMIADGGCQVNQPFLDSQIGPPSDTHGCCTAVDQPGSVDRIGALTGNEWGDRSYYIDNQIPVWVPIYSGGLQGNGAKAYYDIVGFGAVVFMGSDGSPHAKWLKGAAVQTSWCWGVDEETGQGDKFCPGPGGSFNVGATGQVQLRR
jgi:hypothetical protein